MTTPLHLASEFAVNVLDARSLLAAFGALGVGVVLFAETGPLIGFFLPGDSLLFTAGLLCAGAADRAVKLSLAPLLVAVAVGALAGAQRGYLIGRKAGGALIARSRSQRVGAHYPHDVLAGVVVGGRVAPVTILVLRQRSQALARWLTARRLGALLLTS